MRDKKRIDRFINIIKYYWKLYPDFRFGQLISNAVGNRDIFYIEDNDLLDSVGLLFDKISHCESTNADKGR